MAREEEEGEGFLLKWTLCKTRLSGLWLDQGWADMLTVCVYRCVFVHMCMPM